MTATTELVVPRSMPMIFAMSILLKSGLNPVESDREKAPAEFLGKGRAIKPQQLQIYKLNQIDCLHQSLRLERSRCRRRLVPIRQSRNWFNRTWRPGTRRAQLRLTSAAACQKLLALSSTLLLLMPRLEP